MYPVRKGNGKDGKKGKRGNSLKKGIRKKEIKKREGGWVPGQVSTME